MSSTLCPKPVRLSVRPDSALVDDPVHITVKGLSPHVAVTIQAYLDEDGLKFGSSGHYFSDQSGDIDMTKSSSLGGTFTGVEPMGLFWSMKLTPGQKRGLRLLKRDVTVPYRVQISVKEGLQGWEELWETVSTPLARTEVLRYYKGLDVKRTEIEHGRVRGTLFVPPGKGPFPGVIDMFGTAGGLLEFRAALLASRGFTTFALPYFNYKDLPRFIQDVDLDYFLEAVDWFSSIPEVQPGGLGVVGVSKGGELSLLLSSYSSKISACVNITGPPHISGRGIKYGNTFLPGKSLDVDRIVFTDEGAVISDGFAYDREHVIPFGKSPAKFLVLLGDDDCGYSGKHIQREISLLPASKQKDFEVIVYPGAGHLIEPPYAPHCRVAYYSLTGQYMEKFLNIKRGSVPVVWGGKTKLHSDAEEHSWAKLIQFFRDNVGYNAAAEKSKL